MKKVPNPFQFVAANAPMQGEVQLTSGTTAYWEYGTAKNTQPSLVFVHGFRGDHHGLEFIVSCLGDYHCVIPDLPGFGLSQDFSSLASIQAYTDWLNEFTRTLFPTGEYVAIGHSFGSIIVAATLASGLPVKRAVLINPIAMNALSGPRAIATRLAVFYYWLAQVLPEKLGFSLLKARAIVRVMSVTMAKTRDTQLRKWIHNQHDLYFSKFASRKSVMQAFQTSVSHDVSQFSDQLVCDLLLIAGEKDDITPQVAQVSFASSLQHARLEIIPRVGHLIHYEAPREAASLISAFVNEKVN